MNNHLLELENTNCPFCEADVADLFHKVRDCYLRNPGEFAFVRCRQCGLNYLNPRPTLSAMELYYAGYEGYDAPRKKSSLIKYWLTQYGLWKRCRQLVHLKTTGKVLDIGCGSGHFLAAIRRYTKWAGVGVDRSPKAIAFARDNLNLDVYVSQVERLEFPAQTFDAVTLWDVLEHLHQPQEVLSEIQRVLKPCGYLILRVPSADSLDARLFGPFWAGLDAPRHLTLFSSQSLTRFLSQAGFTVRRIWCLSGGHASFVLSLRFLLTCKNKPSPFIYLLQKFIASPLGTFMSAPYFFMVDKLRLGPEITILAQRR